MFCQINLFKPSNTSFTPGETIAGVIKYAVHETMEFERITTSLKGSGQLRVRADHGKRDKTYTANETYVDMDNVVTATNIQVPIGCYEIKFNFKIPENLPSSLEYIKTIPRYKIKCRINYYIRIKFERPGWFSFAKHFRKEIDIVSGITPQLLMEPVIYGESKKLMRLFSRKNAIVGIKATILNSVIPTGSKIHVNYEIKNDTNVVIGCVETKLIEVYSFKAQGHAELNHHEVVPNTTVRLGSIDGGVTRTWPLGLDPPIDRLSLQNSKIVARNYLVRITAELPMPHRNVVLDIPVQIGTLPVINLPEHTVELPTAPPITYEDPPPSYWEAMGEMSKADTLDDDNDCNDFEKGEKSSTL